MPVRKQGGESNRFVDRETPVTMGFTHRPARKNAEAHRALELLEDYHAKLTRPQDKQLRLAIERVIRIFKSRLFQALLDSISYEWPLVCSPYIIFVILGYLYFVLWAGPRYMKDRPPYNLKTIILIYNLFQILINLWLLKEHIAYGWLSEFFSFTACPSFSSPKTLRLLNVLWWVYLSRILDFLETCIFVLRKKQKQVSFLHVYHHVSVVVFGWHFLRTNMDERMSVASLVNSIVHAIMYTYYFISAWSPELQQMVHPLKSFITKMQMIQFVGLITYAVWSTQTTECPSQTSLITFFNANLLIYLVLFYNFYVKNYTKISKQNKK